MLELDKEDYKILKEILKKYPYMFYAYGSRVKGKARKYSDLDIFCKEKMKEEDIYDLKEELEESDMEIKVDVIDPSVCREEFIEIIKKDLVEIK